MNLLNVGCFLNKIAVRLFCILWGNDCFAVLVILDLWLSFYIVASEVCVIA